jgi:putative transposase
MEDSSLLKSARARVLSISRSTLYYRKKQPTKDWALKVQIEEVLRKHHAYGHRRIATTLGHRDERRVLRVMKLFGIKPYRRRGRKYQRKKRISVIYANLLLLTAPSYRHHIWAADFTEIWHKGTKIYVATIIDLYTREILGVAIAKNKGLTLTMAALQDALLHHPRPGIFHSDNGSEYRAYAYVETLERIGTAISRSHPGCPWENGYQESFYNQFKVELGDPNRFKTLGELIAEIYRTIHYYNTERIHSALNMPPREFARRAGAATMHPTV